MTASAVMDNGRTIKDNKGNVVKAYEPYFSSTPEYEDEAELVEQGVSPLMHYDPLGRLIRTAFPNGTFSRVAFTPWEQTSYDPNDTVLTSDWYASRIDYAGSDVALLKEKRAAQQSAAHANTPSKVVLDSLGRPFLALAQLEVDVFLATKSVLDIQGRVLQVIDARGNTAESRTYGMLGQSLEVLSHDAGDRTHLLNALGQPMRSWDDRNQRHSVIYDTLSRPVDRSVSLAGGAEKLLSRIIYGDDLANPTTTKSAGRVYRCYDGAGVATTLAYDFKGHPLEEQRQLVAQKTAQADWSILFGEDTIAEMATAAASLLDAETFSASSERDALGRVLTAVSPDGSEVHYHYDEGGALQRVTLHHRGSTTEQTPVGEITYDAKGRRESITHGPLASPTSTTNYTYDPTSQRLTRLRTVRASDDETIQSLHYHYDAVGNITDIRDTAQQTVYFQNSVVEAANSYTYDGLYRLVEATGREHASEGTSQRTHADLTATPQPMTSDPSAMRRYTQKYVYDEVGNILEMRHIPATGTGWTRYYEYDEDGNRLLATSAPGDAPEGPYSHEYPYDAHGNMTAMPHLSSMVWNHDDELVSAVAGTETVYFQYAGGHRARKYTEKPGSTTEERIYLGNFEIYRKRVGGTIDVERESLHVSDDTGRILLIETKTIDAGSAVTTPEGIWRYQISNHLGSAATELTEDGDIISYEEYHPYGTTAYRAVDSSIDVSAKRYRYTGMERDEETGLSYHTARYYASWLGRWTAPDPIGQAGGGNRYGYARNSPAITNDRSGKAPPDTVYTQDDFEPLEVEGDAVTGSSLVTDDDVEIQARSDYFDNGIAHLTYYGAERLALIEYDNGASLTVDTSDIRTIKYSSRTPGTAGFGVDPSGVTEPEVPSDYFVDAESGRIMPSEINIENSPVFIDLLRVARTNYERDTRAAAEAGIKIYSDPEFQMAVLGGGGLVARGSTSPRLARPASKKNAGGLELSEGNSIQPQSVGAAARTGLGSLKKVDSGRLKALGIDAEVAKAEFVGKGMAGKYNISTDASGQVWLTPVKKGGGEAVETGADLDTLALQFPLDGRR